MTSTDFILIAGGVAILALSGFLCHLIFNLTQVIKEGRKTVVDVNAKLEKVNPVIDETSKTMVDLNESIQAINSGILKPLASFAQVFKGLKQAAGVFTAAKEKFEKKD